jgi:serine/threonine-protein kinase
MEPTTQDSAHHRIGDYEILGTLGSGGMGRVYRVRHIISDRVEAMKILLPDLAERKELGDRFLREIKLVGSLNHPNIASLCTALTINNQLIMVMEFVDGVTLTELLNSGPIAISDARDYLDQALSALGYAHQKGIIHRDIKPANIMLTPSGVIKLMDFGIARTSTERALTQTGTTVGSIDYMSPEQIMGQPVDARSDLYSVGVSFYEMVTGQRPFKASSDFELMAAHVKQIARSPIEIQQSLPLRLNEIIMKSIAKSPADRYQTAEELREALRTVGDSTTNLNPSHGNRSATIVEGLSVPMIDVPSQVGEGRGMTMLMDNARMDRGMTQVAGTPTYYPPQPAALAVRPKGLSRRALYVASGTVLALCAIAIPTVYISHHHAVVKTEPAPESQIPAPSTPKVVPATVVPQQGHRPSAMIPKTHPQAITTVGKVSAVAAVDVPTTTSVGPPPLTPDKKAKLDELEPQIDQLGSRAVAVNNSLNNMQRTMQKDGMALRGDIVARQASMNNNLSKTRQAFGQQDVDRAGRYAGLTDSDLTQLETFLGR